MLNETGLVATCQIEGTVPMFGNNDKRRLTRDIDFVQRTRGRQLDAIHREVRGA